MNQRELMVPQWANLAKVFEIDGLDLDFESCGTLETGKAPLF
jgi:hypothetical protein